MVIFLELPSYNMHVSRHNANEHVSKLMHSFYCLNDKGLRCRCEKYLFELPYFGYTFSAEGIARVSKFEAVMKIPGHYGKATLSFDQEIKYLEVGS